MGQEIKTQRRFEVMGDDIFKIVNKILNNQITILRVFSEKQNYLNLNDFILKEKSEKYLIIK